MGGTFSPGNATEKIEGREGRKEERVKTIQSGFLGLYKGEEEVRRFWVGQ